MRDGNGCWRFPRRMGSRSCQSLLARGTQLQPLSRKYYSTNSAIDQSKSTCFACASFQAALQSVRAWRLARSIDRPSPPDARHRANLRSTSLIARQPSTSPGGELRNFRFAPVVAVPKLNVEPSRNGTKSPLTEVSTESAPGESVPKR